MKLSYTARKNQEPLAKNSSARLALLTGGSFDALRTHFNQKDDSILVGIHLNRDQVQVGGMSAGTCPVPFIVDDILVDFYDPRSVALAQLASKTQLILFIYHS